MFTSLPPCSLLLFDPSYFTQLILPHAKSSVLPSSLHNIWPTIRMAPQTSSFNQNRRILSTKMASRACLAALAASGARTSAFSVGRHGVKSITALSPSVNLFRDSTPVIPRTPHTFQLHMSSTEAAPTALSAPRVKTSEAKISDELVSIKGWVKTVRKQKTLAFVEVNDGSNMSGIQCVLPFDQVDEATIAGAPSAKYFRTLNILLTQAYFNYFFPLQKLRI